MAITGAGARLHNQDASNLPLLYDFEEFEGELDFRTRLVAVTLDPAVLGTSSITLGEVDFFLFFRIMLIDVSMSFILK